MYTVTHASEYRSVVALTGWPASCSGAAQLGEYIASFWPATIAVSSARFAVDCFSTSALHFAMPKSASLGQPDRADGVEQDVLRLDVAMDDAERVRLAERGAHRGDDARGLGERLLAVLADDLGQRPAVHELADLHRHPRLRGRSEVPEVVDAQRVGVREARQRERLLHEVLVAGPADARLAAEAGEHLDAHRPAQPLVVAAVHDAVTAGRDLLDDAVTLEHEVADADRRRRRASHGGQLTRDRERGRPCPAVLFECGVPALDHAVDRRGRRRRAGHLPVRSGARRSRRDAGIIADRGRAGCGRDAGRGAAASADPRRAIIDLRSCRRSHHHHPDRMAARSRRAPPPGAARHPEAAHPCASWTLARSDAAPAARARREQVEPRPDAGSGRQGRRRRRPRPRDVDRPDRAEPIRATFAR